MSLILTLSQIKKEKEQVEFSKVMSMWIMMNC